MNLKDEPNNIFFDPAEDLLPTLTDNISVIDPIQTIKSDIVKRKKQYLLKFINVDNDVNLGNVYVRK